MADYVTIELSKKQIDFEKPYVSEKNGKEYVRCLAPNGGSFFYPKDSFKEVEGNDRRVSFMRPVGTEITLRYSERIEGVPDSAPNEEKYRNIDKVVKIEDLREMYLKSSEEYRAAREEHDSLYQKMSVPESWGRHFNSKTDGTEYVSISIPIKEQDGGRKYYDFIVAAEHFRVDQQGNGNFSFPIMQKDNPEEPYMVQLRTSVKVEEGKYEERKKMISTADLAAEIEKCKEASKKISITISDKLVRYFTSKENVPYCNVAVPVLKEDSNEQVYYNIIVPDYFVKREDNGYGTMVTKLSLPDSDDFMFEAKHGVKNEETGEYTDEIMNLSAKEVAEKFNESNKRYEEEQAAQQAAQQQDAPAKEEGQEQEASFRPHRGR